ncbi:uncharacterized protein CELE_C09G4.4 [Caenorhabditis elegans]|uniref:C09G4.4 protein n=1 Tax=Caenorhabditis elegans TaxID=6239 RepID=G5ED81_CAEEL|nr:Uncharacterized protein CELE_C09G4.4 [Caenorhabditis elegans]AAC27122.1 unknown [Caenorhabditis elegans]CCD64000.1 Uncharacterized protein CELE_C09G4.4 [Caenorhabditis elegans]|eukprot:NP_001021319.1 Uncharacterized protein CELE_C09G4.4 [Caenorhabditis elegans]
MSSPTSSKDYSSPKHSFMLTVDSNLQSDKKKTFLNVQSSSSAGSTKHCQIPMSKDEYFETRGKLDSVDVIDQFRQRQQ